MKNLNINGAFQLHKKFSSGGRFFRLLKSYTEKKQFIERFFGEWKCFYRITGTFIFKRARQHGNCVFKGSCIAVPSGRLVRAFKSVRFAKQNVFRASSVNNCIYCFDKKECICPISCRWLRVCFWWSRCPAGEVCVSSIPCTASWSCQTPARLPMHAVDEN